MKKLFLMAAAAATLFASCAKEENPNAESGDAARMGLSFTLPTTSTRAQTSVNGVGSENTITKITVFVFNATGDAVTGNGTERALADFTASSNTYTLQAGKEIQTTAGARKIYIAANLPAGFTATSEAALLARKVAMSDAVNGTTDLVMFSGKIDKTVAATQIAGSTASPTEIAANAAANKVTASMERLVAKVVVTRAANTFTQTFAHIGGGFQIVYTVDNWGIGTGVSSVYAVKGAATTGEYNAFNANAFTNTMAALANAQTTAAAGTYTYVGENSPYSYGEMTYAMVRTKAAPNKVAKDDGAGAITWVTSSALTDLHVVLSVDDEAYFCESSADAAAVKAILGSGAETYTYPGSYVWFTVFLNHTASTKAGVLARNEFVHVNVTGVTNDVFGGTPGAAPNGNTPSDPSDPNQPDPFDPNEPITEEIAYLTVEVAVSPWLYEQIDLDLE